MSTEDEQLRTRAQREIDQHKNLVEKDPYRLKYHIMPPVGLLNDPNGFIHWKGTYHLFYQWMPFKTGHGAKFWAHVSSQDLVNWKEEEIALTPSEWYEKNGCYSGSAIEHEGKLYVFYTGNVKNEEGNRETYQCLAISEDGNHFDKKGPVVHLPSEYTPHFRDPKVWKQDETYFMVVGAQTTDLHGAVALFRSTNLTDWIHEGILAGGNREPLGNFGYMFECPDLFHLDGKDILIFSPQGLKVEGLKYHNVYQAGYVVGEFDPNTATYQHESFEELDRGFDFYAPQTTEDEHGRRLLFAWMSVPDQNEQEHPTISYKWLHNMTLPRELRLVNGKVYQFPVEELQKLRSGNEITHQLELRNEKKELKDICGKAVEIRLTDINMTEGWFEMTIGGAARILYSKEKQLFTLERQSYVDGIVEKRQCEIEEVKTLHVFLDTSSIEVFINEGEETFTARFYPDPENDSIEFGASKSCDALLQMWSLTKE